MWQGPKQAEVPDHLPMLAQEVREATLPLRKVQVQVVGPPGGGLAARPTPEPDSGPAGWLEATLSAAAIFRAW